MRAVLPLIPFIPTCGQGKVQLPIVEEIATRMLLDGLGSALIECENSGSCAAKENDKIFHQQQNASCSTHEKDRNQHFVADETTNYLKTTDDANINENYEVNNSNRAFVFHGFTSEMDDRSLGNETLFRKEGSEQVIAVQFWPLSDGAPVPDEEYMYDESDDSNEYNSDDYDSDYYDSDDYGSFEHDSHSQDESEDYDSDEYDSEDYGSAEREMDDEEKEDYESDLLISLEDYKSTDDVQHTQVQVAIMAWVNCGENMINTLTDEKGRPPLHLISMMNITKDVEYLILEGGADVNLKDNGGYTALDVAIYNEFDMLAGMLMRYGALRGFEVVDYEEDSDEHDDSDDYEYYDEVDDEDDASDEDERDEAEADIDDDENDFELDEVDVDQDLDNTAYHKDEDEEDFESREFTYDDEDDQEEEEDEDDDDNDKDEERGRVEKGEDFENFGEGDEDEDEDADEDEEEDEDQNEDKDEEENFADYRDDYVEEEAEDENEAEKEEDGIIFI